MAEAATASTIEFLTWVSLRPRTYAETMEAWRSTCPRLSVWEDALMNKLVEVVESADTMDHCQVVLTASGRATLTSVSRPD